VLAERDATVTQLIAQLVCIVGFVVAVTMLLQARMLLVCHVLHAMR
jgi:hypothetical protein